MSSKISNGFIPRFGAITAIPAIKTGNIDVEIRKNVHIAICDFSFQFSLFSLYSFASWFEE